MATKLQPGVAKVDVTLFAGRVQNALDDFTRRLNQYVVERVAAGDDRAAVLVEIQSDFNSRGPLYRRIGGDVGAAIDFGANTTFARKSNPRPTKRADLFVWTLDPAAEHCDSCLHQADQPPRPFDEIPLPTQQPTHGETNCREYCKCTLTPSRNAGGAGAGSATPTKPTTPAPTARKKPAAPKPPRAPEPPPRVNDIELRPPAPVQVAQNDLKVGKGIPQDSVDAVMDGLSRSAGAYGAELKTLAPATSRTYNGQYTTANLGEAGGVTMNRAYLKNADEMVKSASINYELGKRFAIKDAENELQIQVAKGGAMAGVRANRLRAKIKQFTESERWSISTTAPNGAGAIARTANHEGWHAVYFQKRLNVEWEKALQRNNCESPWLVSQYAAKNNAETFAETGAAIAYGVKIPENYVRAFNETLAKIR